MSADAHAETAQKLIGVLSEGRIPNHLRQRAEALVDRMTKPVRVTIFGFPGSGKSTLANLLLGSSVLNPKDRLPTVQIIRGDAAKSSCTLPDGSTVDFPHFNTAEIAAKSPIFVTAEMPLPALGKISVMEIVANGGPSELSRALAWAAGRTDISIWCTQNFGPSEQSVWKGATEDMKDHGFMVLTKADALARDGTLNSVVATLQQQGAEEFNRILPVATLDAIAARKADGTIDRDQLTRSGGRALISEILREVDLGLQAAVDQAEILLQRFPSKASPAPAAKVEETPKPASAATETVAPVAPEPEVASAPEPAVEPAAEAASAEAPRVSTRVRSRPAPEMPPRPAVMPVNILAVARNAQQAAKAAPETADVEEEVEAEGAEATPTVAALSPATREAFEHAIDRLTQHGQKFAGDAAKGGALEADQLMRETARSVQWLSDYLSENGDVSDPVLSQLRSAAFDAADLLQLMQIENDTGAVGEFVSVAIQLRREMESALAA